MRARFAISIIAVVGVLFTVGAGAAFAQGIGGTDSAGQQQYGTTTPAPSETDVLGEIGEVEESQPAPAETQEAAPAPAPQAAAQPAEQQSGSLPFTGFATLAVVLLGVALLMGGLVLRRGTRQRHRTDTT